MPALRAGVILEEGSFCSWALMDRSMVGIVLVTFLVCARRSSSLLIFYTFAGAKLIFSSNLSLLVGWNPPSSSPKVVKPFKTPLSS